MKFRRRVLVLLAAGGIAGLATTVVAIAGETKPQAAKKPITIGMAIAQTGLVSPFDAGPSAAAEIAISDINKKGGVRGYPLSVVKSDTKSEIALGANAAQEVIAKGAQVLIVSCDYDYGGAAARTGQSKGKLVFSLCAESPKFGVQGIGPLAFTMGTGTPEAGAMMAEYMYKKRNARKAYILVDASIEYTRTVCGYFERRWKELSGTSLVGKDTFQNSDPSVATQITRMKASAQPDFIFFCSYVPGGVSAIKQIRGAGINTPIATVSAMDGNYLTGAIPNLSNVIFEAIGSIYGDDPRPAINDLVKRLKAVGKAPPNAYTLYGYSVIEAIAEAIKRAAKAGVVTLDGARLAHALETFRGVKLLIGPTTYTPKLHLNIERPLQILEIQDGKIHYKEQFVPSRVPPITFR